MGLQRVGHDWATELTENNLLCPFGILSLKRVRKFYLFNWFLESWLRLKFISAEPTRGRSLRGAGLNSPTGLTGELQVPVKCWWSSCSYRKCPQGGSTSSCPAPVLASRALSKVEYLGCDLDWNVLGKHRRPCISLHLPRDASSFPYWLILPAPPLPAELPRRLHSQEEGFSWGPQHQGSGSLVILPWSTRPERRAIIVAGH